MIGDPIQNIVGGMIQTGSTLSWNPDYWTIGPASIPAPYFGDPLPDKPAQYPIQTGSLWPQIAVPNIRSRVKILPDGKKLLIVESLPDCGGKWEILQQKLLGSGERFFRCGLCYPGQTPVPNDHLPPDNHIKEIWSILGIDIKVVDAEGAVLPHYHYRAIRNNFEYEAPSGRELLALIYPDNHESVRMQQEQFDKIRADLICQGHGDKVALFGNNKLVGLYETEKEAYSTGLTRFGSDGIFVISRVKAEPPISVPSVLNVVGIPAGTPPSYSYGITGIAGNTSVNPGLGIGY